ncbi:hypothetical protein O6H91_23G068900 [Diphasiastrum complanatum]|uniref:Uncharacterized protein n=1 Tax=Diphasiastrum complanatum TaxID=34168 RepID=A0ACC2ABW2_DIPCM|nr:hypothetical protein O6H91_23G068900 [Diphasiastrum complanatum]
MNASFYHKRTTHKGEMAMAMAMGVAHCFSSSTLSPFALYAGASKPGCCSKALSVSIPKPASGFSNISLNLAPSPFLPTTRNCRKPQERAIVVCKLKTHKASAKRFTVTGSGKIVRRKAGKQHLLRKKNAKRRNRLSHKTDVDKSDYNNVIGALPYLKVVRR